MKRRLICTLLLVGCCFSLMGCDNAEIKELKNISAMEDESTVKALKLSASDKESQVYAQVSDRTLLDLSALDSVSTEDTQAVNEYLKGVENQLNGDGTFKYLNDSFVNYILYEMQKTPYYWNATETNIRGMDSTSRSIVVDVTYKSNGGQKPIKKDSPIPKGVKDYDNLMKARYNNWLGVLEAKYAKNKTLADTFEQKYADFVNAYGDPQEIIDSQVTTSLSEVMYKDKSLSTYSCMQNSDNSGIGATMTIRYVLVPNYVMGINQGMSCKHLYLTDYELDSDPTSNFKVNNDEGNEVINKSIDELLHSYYTALDEDNHRGLSTLVTDYGKWDKHFQDQFNTAYSKNKGYTISLFEVDGTKIKCGVTLNRSIRSKDANMSMPIYTERYLYTLELVDEKLRIVDETLLSSKISGEPKIDASEAQTTGFSSEVNLEIDDKVEIEKQIANLGVVQLTGDMNSEAFGQAVDLSLSNSQLTDIKNTLTSITAEKKSVWITNYLQGFNNYASVKVKELYQKKDGSLYDAVATVDLMKKGGVWYVNNYSIASCNKLDTTEYSDKNALCTVTAGGVESLNSKATPTNPEESTEVSSEN